MKKISLLLILVFVLCSCAGRPTNEDLVNADYGKYPADYEQIIKNYYATRIYEPDSARFTFTKPNRRPNIVGDNTRYGYAVCGTVDAVNRSGKFIGARPFYVLIKNGHVIQHYGHQSVFINTACERQKTDAVEDAQAAMKNE